MPKTAPRQLRDSLKGPHRELLGSCWLLQEPYMTNGVPRTIHDQRSAIHDQRSTWFKQQQARSDRGSQAFVTSSTSAVFHFLTMPQVPVPMMPSIDSTSLRAARQKCARLAADEHLAKAATHVSMAKDIMAKAPDYNFTPISFCVDARIKAAKRLQGFLDSDTEGRAELSMEARSLDRCISWSSEYFVHPRPLFYKGPDASEFWRHAHASFSFDRQDKRFLSTEAISELTVLLWLH